MHASLTFGIHLFTKCHTGTGWLQVDPHWLSSLYLKMKQGNNKISNEEEKCGLFLRWETFSSGLMMVFWSKKWSVFVSLCLSYFFFQENLNIWFLIVVDINKFLFFFFVWASYTFIFWIGGDQCVTRLVVCLGSWSGGRIWVVRGSKGVGLIRLVSRFCCNWECMLAKNRHTHF